MSPFGRVDFTASAVLRHTRSRPATASHAAPCICGKLEPVQSSGYNSYGGMGNTPSYLVRLRPVVKVDDDRIAVGRDGMAVGETFTMAIELVSPNGTQHLENRHINGNLSSIGIVCQDVVMPEAMADEDKTGARLLYEEALNYIDRWNASEQQLASLLQVERIRPVPTVVNLGGVLEVTYLMDTPHQVEWQGLYIDADLRACEAVPARRIEGLMSDPVALFTQLSGLQGSVLENRLFEDDFGVGAISTAKLFGHAAQAGIPILTIEAANIDTLFPTLPFADNIKADITNAVNQGLVVRIPGSEISYEDWTGIGYIKQDPATFEAGYMLSGMIAGGMTAWYIERWDDTPFHATSSHNDNPGAACYIQRISGTDMQEGMVGTEFKKPLQVRVTDSMLRPVRNAPVTFTLTAGGGTLKAGTEQGTTVHAVTNHLGIADVFLSLGEKTSNNPVFRKREGDIPYAQQISCHIVDASLLEKVNDEKFIIKNEDFITRMIINGEGFLIAEGVEPIISGTEADKKKALVLQLTRGNNILLASRLNLTIDGVEKMFRHKNLRSVLGASGGADDRDTAPNFPDDPSCNKAFVFTHGFNVSGEAARAWHCEVFKRMFWSGSKARFYGVTWYGDEGIIPVAYYRSDVINAFETSRYFDEFIREIKGDGEVVVAAHSLGNMMVSAAIQDYGTQVDRYFLINAALAREVFNSSFVDQDTFMTHKEWRDKGYEERLYASKWHELFAEDLVSAKF